jgi:predicted nucleotidyltransferase
VSREQIVEMIRSHRADLERFDVKSLSLFGSVARDEAEDSDVDVLVEFASPATFIRTSGSKSTWKNCWGDRWTS